MATWLFSGSAASQSSDVSGAVGSQATPTTFDELLNAATSELLPTPVIAKEESAIDAELLEKGLSMSDLVRSGAYKASEAVRLFRKKLVHKNPNVVLRSLLCLDVAIKNSGDQFLKEVAGLNSSASNSGTKSIVDDLADLIRMNTNHDVKNTALRLVQNWATAFQSKPPLSISEMVLQYSRLRAEGQPFPPVSSSATAAMIDSMSAPSWTDNTESTVCSRCRDSFSVLNRRHHCRNCGQLFDQKCSAKTITLPHFGINVPVRVCDGCHKKVSGGNPLYPKRRASFESVSSRSSAAAKIPSRGSSFSHRANHYAKYSPTNKEDEDLQLALRLSLSDTGPSTQQQSYSAPSGNEYGPLRNKAYAPAYPIDKKSEEIDDPDLAAAIAASLRDLENAPAANQEAHLDQYNPEQPRFIVPPTTELGPLEMDRTLTFTQAIESRTVGDLRELEGLYRNAEGCRSTLVKGVGDAGGREQVLVEMRDKLREAMRLYEGLLDREAARHQARSSVYGGYQAQAQPIYREQPNPHSYQPQQRQVSGPPLHVPHQHQPLYSSAYPSVPMYSNAPSQPPQEAYAQPSAPPQMQESPTMQTYSAQAPSQQQQYAHYSAPPQNNYESAPPQHIYESAPSVEQAPDDYQHSHDVQQYQVEANPYPQQDLNPNAPPYQPASAPYSPPRQNPAVQQLANLPHAPQAMPQHFPTVPQHEIMEAREPERPQEGLLIEL